MRPPGQVAGEYPAASPRAKSTGPAALRLLSLLALCVTHGCGFASKGHNISGVRLYQEGQDHMALRRFQQAIQSDPWNADAYYNIAAVYHRTADKQQSEVDYQRAENYYRQTLDRNPQHVAAYRGLAVLLARQRRSEEAFHLLEGWASRSPTSAAPRIELARLYEEIGKDEVAKELLLESLAFEPDNARALAALGHLREETGDTVQAAANYQRSLAANPFQPRLSQRLASLQTSSSAPAPNRSPGTRIVTTIPPRLR